jgi:hypothetical protein
MAGHQEAAWHLLHAYPAKALVARMEHDEKIEFLERLHVRLREREAKNFVRYKYDPVLRHQAGWFGKDLEARLEFCRRILDIHVGSKYYFPAVLTWAQGQFGPHPEYAPRYAEALSECLLAQADEAGEDVIKTEIAKGIRSASERSDLESFRIFNQLASQLVPAREEPAARHLKPNHVRACPSYEVFPGKLVSADSMLQLSTYDRRSDTPLVYEAVLRADPPGGFFHTASEENPWAQVILPGKVALSGLVVVNRWENKGYAARQVPLFVSVSEDGKEWTEIFTSEEPSEVWRVDLNGRGVDAKYVKLEARHHADKKQPFHLRNILVYGTPYY